MARPKKEIDQEQFEKLCGLQCTKEEVADWFDCSEDTIERWCKATYDESFAVVFAKKRQVGKVSLRRMQWKLAQKNASMAIFDFTGKVEVAVTYNLGEVQTAKVRPLSCDEGAKNDDDGGVTIVDDY